MGISWGLETRVLDLYVIECLSCSLLPPQKNKKKSSQKVKIKKFQTQEKSREKEQERKCRKKDDTKDETSTNHHLKKKRLVLGNSKSFKPS